jgi:hypothetical protein
MEVSRVTNSRSDDFHKWAKDAGNKLRAYVLSYASGATAVFFLALSSKDVGTFTTLEKTCLIVALLLYVTTTLLCLYELHIDARRFFHVAKQLELPDNERSWKENDWAKKVRLRLIYSSYISAASATAAVVGFLVARIA